MIYFDHNATSPLLPEAGKAWLATAESYIGNPSSPHRLGGRADAVLAGARELIARAFGCGPLDLVFVSGATEANNTVIQHLAQLHPGRELWISSLEHPSLLAPATHHFGSRLRLIPSTHSGLADLDWLSTQLRSRTPAAIALMAANNETGVLQPWREACQLARDRGVAFFCDATQAAGRIELSGLGQADYFTGSAHKFGGPRGVGFFKCPATGPFHPLLRGGPQEENRRAGTENVPAILAMTAALDRQQTRIQAQEHQLRAHWRDAFEIELARQFPGVQILGAAAPRLWNTSAVLMPQADCRRRWVVKLDRLGFAVSTGSACSSGREEPSHVLRAMGISSDDAGRALRFSAGWETTQDDWRALLQAILKIRDAASRIDS